MQRCFWRVRSLVRFPVHIHVAPCPTSWPKYMLGRPGSVWGFPRKTPGKSREKCWQNFPEASNAANSRISGTRKGKLAGNLGSTLPGPCPHLPCGVFLKSTAPAFSSFSEGERKLAKRAAKKLRIWLRLSWGCSNDP